MLFLAACGSSSESTTATHTEAKTVAEPKKGGTLSMVGTDPSTSENLDPAIASDGNQSMYCGAIYERLTRADVDYKVTPELATKWESTPDGKTWTFHLRPDVTFSDGTPLTSDDVVYSLRRVLDPDLGSPLYDRMAQLVAADDITAPDPQTVVFNLKQPDALVPLVVSSRRAGVVKKGTKDFTKTAIGTGPFVLDTFKPGVSWSTKKNATYWDPKLPYLDGIRLSKADGQPAAVRAVQSGDSDVGGTISFSDAARIKKAGDFKVVEVGPDFMYIAMDMRKKPFDNPKVVEAIKAATDRKALQSIVLQGLGDLTSDTNSWPDNPYYPPSLGVREQDIEKAKALLAEAGYPDGIDIELFTSDVLGGFVELATAFKEVVAPAGIRVKITQADPGSYWSEVWMQEPMYVTYTSSKHPSLWLTQNYTTKAGSNETHIDDPAFDKAVAEAATILDEGERTKAYQDLVLQVADRSGSLIFSTVYALWATKPNVVNLTTDLEDGFDFRRTALT